MGLEVELWAWKLSYGPEADIWAWSGDMILEWRSGPGVELQAWSRDTSLEWRYGPGVEIWAWSRDISLEWRYGPGVEIGAWSGDLGLLCRSRPGGGDLGLEAGSLHSRDPCSWGQVGTEDEFPFSPARAWLPRRTVQWGQQGALVCLQMDRPS